MLQRRDDIDERPQAACHEQGDESDDERRFLRLILELPPAVKLLASIGYERHVRIGTIE